MSLSRLVLIAGACLAFAVAGCTQDTALSRQASFNPSLLQGGQNAIVVVGMRVTEEPVINKWFFGGRKMIAYYEMTFSNIGPDGVLTHAGGRVQLCDRARLFTGDLLDDCEPQRMEYKLLQLPAGRYVLNNSTVRAGQLNQITDWLTPVQHSWLGNVRPSRAGDPVNASALTFTVGPGEILYIGDINWDVRNTPPRFYMTRNDEAARVALAAYPNVNGSMVFRPVAGSPVTPNHTEFIP